MSQPALLVLEDGRSFSGISFGASGESFGEAVFSTGMTGYQETLTDPSYHKQIVVATAPHIGNTGWNVHDDESGRIWVAGYVIRDPSPSTSSWRADRSLDAELRNQNIVGIAGVDTRALARHLRDRGAMQAGISTTELDPATLLPRVREAPPMAGSALVDEVSVDEPYVVPAIGKTRFRVVAVNVGIKSMTPRRMAVRGIETHVLGSTATMADIERVDPDGVFYSNGPGDPAAGDHQTQTLRRVLAAGIGYFGICMGNQILGRALGLGTYKLVYGHHGMNQPVMDLATGKVEITVHNHGFAVDAQIGADIPTEFGIARVSHIDLNDNVVEGLELRDDHGRRKAFSVQYHPEAAAGPHDADYLFDRFADLMAQASSVKGANAETQADSVRQGGR
jgi:carbamoyl-phosphate synthase small subunit